MGGIVEHKNDKADGKKKLTKGQRLGWLHKSAFEGMSLRDFSSQGKKLCTYTEGPFSLDKIVP